MQEELNRSVYIYCGEIINRMFKSKKKKTYWNYPAMASVCCLKGSKKYRGFSQRAYDNSYPQSILRTQLLKLGKIGERVGTKGFRLGSCAEPHAAKKLLKNESQCNDLKDIYFSVAMRPRTRQIFSPCENCKKVFPTLK